MNTKKKTPKVPRTFNVREMVEDYFGGVSEFKRACHETGSPASDSSIYVWMSRGTVPDRTLLCLVLDDPNFDPRDYAWQPS